MINFKRLPKPYTIAEIGGNHEGNFEYAKKLCQLAINTNVDCIKFQLYKANHLVNPLISPIRNNHFKKFELTKKEYIYLAKMCSEAGKDFNASIWSENMIPYVDKFMKFYKIGSGDMNCYPLIKSFLKYGKPIIISTGLATMDEVLETINFIVNENKNYEKESMINVLQCTTMYPIKDSEANISVLEQYKKIKNVGIGYSDHTEGSDALLLASIYGANILEFHFTDSRDDKSFRDHKVSLIPSEVDDLINKISKFKTLEGNSNKHPLETEINSDHLKSFRRALYLNKDLKKGYVIKEEDLIALRPMEGIPSKLFKKMIGMKLKKDILKYQKLDFNFFE